MSGGKGSAALPASSAPAGGAPPPPAPLTPIAGHVVVPWHGSLVLVGGHMKVRGGWLGAVHAAMVPVEHFLPLTHCMDERLCMPA